tara:strand:+ start:456 stop:560 length:105 start_codon:yes stop_codon:yes gene_type:complete
MLEKKLSTQKNRLNQVAQAVLAKLNQIGKIESAT